MNNILEKFKSFILEKDHPCIMAQSVFKMDDVIFHQYDTLGTVETAEKMYDHIRQYLQEYSFESNAFKTFLAIFPHLKINSEKEFETLLWQQLRQIHEIDEHPWDNSVSSDPTSKDFSFSIAGHAFYLVGMHPGSSRKARQAPCPGIAFNLHWQFDKLREMGTYDTIRDKIRQNDIQLQGSINPEVKDFGIMSEAKQYSGRKVEENWKCPFNHS